MLLAEGIPISEDHLRIYILPRYAKRKADLRGLTKSSGAGNATGRVSSSLESTIGASRREEVD